jgi:uncharacterized membrane protein
MQDTPAEPRADLAQARPLPPPPSASPAARRQSGRFALLDISRGLAVAAMVVYHFTWDLGHFGLTTIQASVDPGWRLFAKLIAGSFLFLVGIGLVLAHGERIRWAAFWRRFGILALAAGAITFATWYAMPESFIFFGILHCIAVASLIGLAFLRLPVVAILACAVAALALPQFEAAKSAFFDHPAWLWLGLNPVLPLTNDYEPLLPWLGPVLLGIATARLLRGTPAEARLATAAPRGRAARGLAFVGRHSLVVYLLHQSILFGGLALLMSALGPQPIAAPPAATGFELSCRRTCTQGGTGAEFCEATCGCVADQLEGTSMLSAPEGTPLSDADRTRLDQAVKACIPSQQP